MTSRARRVFRRLDEAGQHLYRARVKASYTLADLQSWSDVSAADQPPIRLGVASQMPTVITADALIQSARRQLAESVTPEG